MFEKISFRKYIAVNTVGFGLAGLCWGLVLYRRLPDLEYPFHYAFVILLAVLGGASLALLRWNAKGILKSIGGGFLGYGVGSFLMSFLIYKFSLYGTFILSIFLSRINPEYFNLDPNIGVSVFWLLFLIIGVFAGLFYALFLKTKVWPMVWRGGAGFALGSLIGPIIGNLLGNLFNSLLVAYLITFAVMSVVLGKFLAWGAYNHRK